MSAPILTVLLGAALLYAINIDERCMTLSASIASVRQAIASSLEVDLTPGHLEDAWNAAVPKPSTEGKTADEKKKIEDSAAAEAKRIAERLAARRTWLAETLAACVMLPHPALSLNPLSAGTTTEAGTGTNRRKDACAELSKTIPALPRNPGPQLESIVANRLSDVLIGRAIHAWTPQAMGPRIERAAAAARIDSSAIATQIADRVDGTALRRSVLALIDPERSPFEPKKHESLWTKDVNARLTWAVTALIFCLAFALVAFTSVGQIFRIHTTDRHLVWKPLTVFIILAFAVALALPAYQPSLDGTPLHQVLIEYSDLFGVHIFALARVFEAIRALGIILLIAGSVATFVVACTMKTELEQQLRGFKSLFNAGAVFLLAAVLEVYARYRWPLAFVADTDAQQLLQSTAAMGAATIGALFSVVLMVAYIATTYVLRRQAIEHGIAADKVDQALTTAGFGDSTQQLMRFAQALLPLLPGALTLFIPGAQ